MDSSARAASALPQLGLGIVVQVLVLCCWFATAAAVPSIAADFDLSRSETVQLTALVQAGFAAGCVLVGLFRLSDRIAPSRLIPVGSTAAALVTVLPLLDPSNLPLLAASRLGVGLLLAAVYPTGMRAAVSWAGPRRRGAAVSGMVAALTVGTAGPYLLEASPVADWRHVLLVCGGVAIVGAALGAFVRTGPHAGPPPARRMSARSNLFGSTIQRRVTLAYVGHMWEVYGLWIWLPALVALLSVPPSASGARGVVLFAVIGASGAVGCVIAGVLAGIVGKRRIAAWSVAVSALCALMTPAFPVMPLEATIAILMLWGAAVIADSPLYSALTGDVATGGQVGSVLAVQMGLGYAVSIGAVVVVPAIAELVGWQWAFLVLAIGSIVSLIALRDRVPGGGAGASPQ